MKNNAFVEEIQTYLSGAMRPGEAKAFEAELKRNPELQKAFFQQSVKSYKPPSAAKTETRQLVKAVYETLQPIPDPVLPWYFSIRVWWQSLLGKVMILGGLLALALLGWMIARTPVMPPPPLLSFVEKEYCPGVASQITSDVFCKESTSLVQLETLTRGCRAEFCLAEYYLAHKYLKAGKYSDAVPAFEHCLAHYDTLRGQLDLPAGTDLRNALEFNRIVAQVGEGKKSKTALGRELTELEPGLKGYTRLESAAAALRANYLRED